MLPQILELNHLIDEISSPATTPAGVTAATATATTISTAADRIRTRLDELATAAAPG